MPKTQIPKNAMINFDRATYLKTHDAEEKQQVLKAAWHLAELLGRINWHD